MTTQGQGTEAPDIREWLDTDLDSVAEVVSRVWSDGRHYPHPTEHDGSRASLLSWLQAEPRPIARLVATVAGAVVGHVQLETPHDYLTRFLSRPDIDIPSNGSLEIGKLFVDPRARGAGVGRQLLEQARKTAGATGHWCVLAVVDSSESAKRMYQSAGMREAGVFDGEHGLNHVFVDRD